MATCKIGLSVVISIPGAPTSSAGVAVTSPGARPFNGASVRPDTDFCATPVTGRVAAGGVSTSTVTTRLSVKTVCNV